MVAVLEEVLIGSLKQMIKVIGNRPAANWTASRDFAAARAVDAILATPPTATRFVRMANFPSFGRGVAIGPEATAAAPSLAVMV